ncbi:MAG TPA: hypothetical protein VNL77_17360, partial [Roseiflexaceae bacterium]|nr:hypothetical protein [Roseiflexaceae bacterium]
LLSAVLLIVLGAAIFFLRPGPALAPGAPATPIVTPAPATALPAATAPARATATPSPTRGITPTATPRG